MKLRIEEGTEDDEKIARACELDFFSETQHNSTGTESIDLEFQERFINAFIAICEQFSVKASVGNNELRILAIDAQDSEQRQVDQSKFAWEILPPLTPPKLLCMMISMIFTRLRKVYIKEFLLWILLTHTYHIHMFLRVQ